MGKPMLNQIRSLLHLNSLGADYVFNSRAEICTNMVYAHDIEDMIESADIEQYLQQEMEFRIERYLFLHYLTYRA